MEIFRGDQNFTQTDRQTDRKKHTHTHTERERERETHTHTHTHTHTDAHFISLVFLQKCRNKTKN